MEVLSAFVFPILIGILVGIYVGFLPGVNVGTALILAFPFMSHFSVEQIFIFYFAVLNTTQYFGSIVAILFGIPGESTSLSAYEHGRYLREKNQTLLALDITAVGSVIGAFISIAFFYGLVSVLPLMLKFLIKGNTILTFLTITIAAFVIFSPNRIKALAAMCFGLLLGQIGTGNIFGIAPITFGLTFLQSGIPVITLLAGLIVIPGLLDFARSDKTTPRLEADLTKNTKLDKSNYLAIGRGSILGFIVGLFPGGSYTIASNLADMLEHRVWKSERINRLAAAESANNAGTISVLMPLLILGVPIVFSEFILLGALESKGFSYLTSLSFFQSHIGAIFTALITINLLNFFLAKALYRKILQMFHASLQRAKFFPLVVVVGVVINEAYASNLLLVSIFLTAFFYVISKYTRSMQTRFTIVTGYFISTMFLDQLYRFLI